MKNMVKVIFIEYTFIIAGETSFYSWTFMNTVINSAYAGQSSSLYSRSLTAR